MKSNLTVCDYEVDLVSYMDNEHVSQQRRDKLTTSDIVVVPSPYEDGKFYFSQETIEFLKYCRSADPEYNIELLADEDIVVRSLHSFDIYMPAVWIGTSILLPFVINLVSNYIYDRLKGREHENAQVHFSAIIHDRDKCKQVSYDGDAKTFRKTFEKIDINKL